ncbi:glycosyltransferase family 2 protein [Roseomonas sp. GC11]|uniref:glycosyltransferase family A protein n=1 Tax=Roseomonas sp. GC11 TaxID=2950546 RepID=UPI00210CC76D|nr:glycosyltransferase family A protein [Roseomonas sp. GC11]MCQ4162167.1 glycosyltransferase family 2 protein [Roseomonas sp. GC11]
MSSSDQPPATATAPGVVMLRPGDRHVFAVPYDRRQGAACITYAAEGGGPLLSLRLEAGALWINRVRRDLRGLPRPLAGRAEATAPDHLVVEWPAGLLRVVLNGALVFHAPSSLLAPEMSPGLPAAGAGGRALRLDLPPGVTVSLPALPAAPFALPYGGAMDHVSAEQGLMGWALDRGAIGHPLRIELVAQGQCLGHTHTVLPRPDLDRAFNATTRCGFALPWHRMEAEAIAALAATAPEAGVELRIAVTGAALPVVGVDAAPLTLGWLAGQLAQRQGLPPATPDRAQALAEAYGRLAESGLLDAAWYQERHGATGDPLLHYLTEGEAAGHWPNPYFDPVRAAAWLRLEEPAGALALYAAAPRRVKQPSLHFHQAWYLLTHAVPPGLTPLADHLLHRRERAPNPFFDPATYRENCPQAAAAPDPYRHYLENPEQAGVAAAASFDAAAYLATAEDPAAAAAPFAHFLQRLAAMEATSLPRRPAGAAAAAAEEGISVVVPNYNYGRFLYQRLDTIFRQTWPVLEVIVIDDASTDDSIDVARSIALHHKRDIELVLQARRGGNVFRQWLRAAERARGRYLWIAEADDSSNPAFLANQMASLAQDEGALFSFCDSRAIDEAGRLLQADHQAYYAAMGASPLAEDRSFTPQEFLRGVLAPRNLVLNVSAVLWRREALLEAFRSLGSAAFAFTCAGDWRIYVEACRQPGRIHYSAAPLNDHRRHRASVGERLDRHVHLAEVKAVQAAILQQTGADAALEGKMARHIADLEKAWGLRSAG